ncbi:MAG: hypothetical protein ACPGQL_04690 [Thermoplasmatota archaeon]
MRTAPILLATLLLAASATAPLTLASNAGDACRGDGLPDPACDALDGAAATVMGSCPEIHDGVTVACGAADGHTREAPFACRFLHESLGIPDPLCKVASTVLDGAGTLCRNSIGNGPASCALLDDHIPDPDAVAAHQQSWAYRALRLQQALGGPVPLAKAQLFGTHNSFNANAYAPTLSGLDPNQQYSLTDQLRMGVRAIEIDVHYFPRLAHGGPWPIVCHGNGDVVDHVGCTNEVGLEVRLAELRAWLDGEGAGEVLYIQIQDELVDEAGHDAGAALIEAHLGDLLYRPADSGRTCEEGLPLDVSQDDIRAAGKQVLLHSDCGVGAAWPALVHDYGTSLQGDPGDACTYTPAQHAGNWTRIFEDGTMVGALVGFGREAMTAQHVADATRCGVNRIDLDHLLPEDLRLAAHIWSWAEDQPDAGLGGDCAAHLADDRFHAADCTRALRAACHGPGGWSFTASVAWDEAAAACAALGATFGVPRTGPQNEALADAKDAAGVPAAWLDYRAGPDGW